MPTEMQQNRFRNIRLQNTLHTMIDKKQRTLCYMFQWAEGSLFSATKRDCGRRAVFVCGVLIWAFEKMGTKGKDEEK